MRFFGAIHHLRMIKVPQRINETEALAEVRATITLPFRTVGLGEALGQFSASDLFAHWRLPAFDNSAMDGYAVLAESCPAGARWQIAGEQPAGAQSAAQIDQRKPFWRAMRRRNFFETRPS